MPFVPPAYVACSVGRYFKETYTTFSSIVQTN